MSAMASQITCASIVYSTIYSDADQRKHQSSVTMAFVREGIHRWPVNSPQKGPATRKMFPFNDVIMIFFITICMEIFIEARRPCYKDPIRRGIPLPMQNGMFLFLYLTIVRKCALKSENTHKWYSWLWYIIQCTHLVKVEWYKWQKKSLASLSPCCER